MLANAEMQIETIVRYHSSPLGWLEEEKQTRKSVDEDVEKLEH